VIAANALDYLLEATRVQGKIKGISLPGRNQLLNGSSTMAALARCDLSLTLPLRTSLPQNLMFQAM
jgi:hypothetical protein